MKDIGKPCAGKPHARFDEGGLGEPALYSTGDGYDFQDSTAFVNEQFLGLPLDEENQSELTEERIQVWVDQVLREAK